MAKKRIELQKVRKASKLTQEQVAAALGITRSQYTSIEIGRVATPVDLAIRIASFFGKSVEELFGAGGDSNDERAGTGCSSAGL